MYSVRTLVEPNRNLYIVCVVYFDILRENFIYTYKFFLQYFFSNYFSFVHLNILSLGTCLATKICYKKCLDDPTLIKMALYIFWYLKH